MAGSLPCADDAHPVYDLDADYKQASAHGRVADHNEALLVGMPLCAVASEGVIEP
jgi:hypothetical protein